MVRLMLRRCLVVCVSPLPFTCVEVPSRFPSLFCPDEVSKGPQSHRVGCTCRARLRRSHRRAVRAHAPTLPHTPIPAFFFHGLMRLPLPRASVYVSAVSCSVACLVAATYVACSDRMRRLSLFFSRVCSRVVVRVLCLFPLVRFGPSNPVYFPSTRHQLGRTFPFSYDRLQSQGGTDVALDLTRGMGV